LAKSLLSRGKIVLIIYHAALNGCHKLFYMNKKSVLSLLKSFIVLAALVIFNSAMAQSTSKEKKLVKDCKEAKDEFIAKDDLMKNLFSSAYGYVIFPNVGKGGIGIGGAVGNGIVYDKGFIIGKAKLTQLSVGFQFGGQAYREVIFFETKADLDRFKENKIEFSAQASAVAVTAGASANVKYKDGVMIFSQLKGGLMYEASIGGQKFNYSSF
jgi:lipid-binding SYLF domain-containing protein